MRSSVFILVALAGTTLSARHRPAGAQTSAVLTLSDGRTVEVIGLRRWTLRMLQDSLARYAPGDSLQSHACAATLRYKLHFADAASTTFSDGSGRGRVVVAVREPQDSAKVKYRSVRLDTVGARSSWKAISDAYENHPNVFWPEVQARFYSPLGTRPQYRSADDSAVSDRFVATLTSLRRESNRREAMQALASSPNMYDRIAAATILGNFSKDDATWWALVEALREEDGHVKAVAATILQGLSRSAPRAVSWSNKAATIHALLNGTSLFVLDDVVQVLPRTKVGPRDARAFLGKGGGDMLLAYLGSRELMLSADARRLLTALRGKDLGPDDAPWQAWLSSL